MCFPLKSTPVLTWDKSWRSQGLSWQWVIALKSRCKLAIEICQRTKLWQFSSKILTGFVFYSKARPAFIPQNRCCSKLHRVADFIEKKMGVECKESRKNNKNQKSFLFWQGNLEFLVLLPLLLECRAHKYVAPHLFPDTEGALGALGVARTGRQTLGKAWDQDSFVKS